MTAKDALDHIQTMSVLMQNSDDEMLSAYGELIECDTHRIRAELEDSNTE